MSKYTTITNCRNCLRRNIILDMAQSNSDGQNLSDFQGIFEFFFIYDESCNIVTLVTLFLVWRWSKCIRLVTYVTLFLDFLFIYLFFFSLMLETYK